MWAPASCFCHQLVLGSFLATASSLVKEKPRESAFAECEEDERKYVNKCSRHPPPPPLPPGDIWRHFQLSHGGGGLLATGSKVRDAAQHPPIHGTALHRQELSGPNVNGARVEKP